MKLEQLIVDQATVRHVQTILHVSECGVGEIVYDILVTYDNCLVEIVQFKIEVISVDVSGGGEGISEISDRFLKAGCWGRRARIAKGRLKKRGG